MAKKKTDNGKSTNEDSRRTERGRELANLRQSKTDPGSPCETCRIAVCPPYCKPKHDFERWRNKT